MYPEPCSLSPASFLILASLACSSRILCVPNARSSFFRGIAGATLVVVGNLAFFEKSCHRAAPSDPSTGLATLSSTSLKAENDDLDDAIAYYGSWGNTCEAAGAQFYGLSLWVNKKDNKVGR